jgi:hypothetical protein
VDRIGIFSRTSNVAETNRTVGTLRFFSVLNSQQYLPVVFLHIYKIANLYHFLTTLHNKVSPLLDKVHFQQQSNTLSISILVFSKIVPPHAQIQCVLVTLAETSLVSRKKQ